MSIPKKKKKRKKKKILNAVTALFMGASAQAHQTQLNDWHQAYLNDDIANSKELRQDAVAHYEYFSRFLKELSAIM